MKATLQAGPLARARLMNTYRQAQVTFVRGEGMHLFDDRGREYLDFVAGIAVNALGHCHPAVVEAIAQHSTRLIHASNLYYTEPALALADRLCRLLKWPDGKVFFGNSGAEANECAIKLARKWAGNKFKEPRYKTIAALRSFHGRTLATLAATGQPEKWKSFSPMPGGFVHVGYDDAPALKRAIDGDVGSVLLEPILGEAGVVVPSNEYLPAVRQICTAHDVAFILDEVQTGLGRTGEWFAFQSTEAVPDVITLAKSLGNGLPIGACIARGEIADAFVPGDHASTMGGGPLVSAVSLAVIDAIEDENLVANAKNMGAYLLQELQSLAARRQEILQVRGKGLMLAVELSADNARDVVLAAMEKGVLLNDVSPGVIRMLPPLIAKNSECDQAVSVLEQALAAAGGSK